ncbi:MAG: GGDEF-domain containing protein, partial [Cyanobacteria bacterium J06632_22]
MVASLGGRAYADDIPSVLVIHSYHPDLSWTAKLTAGIDDGFSSGEIEVFHEYLDAKRYPQLEHGQAFLDYLNQKYANAGIDVLMVSDDPGLGLVLAERTELLAELPIVFLGINRIDPALVNRSGVTGVFETHSVVETATEALHQHDADALIVMTDSSETGRANLARIDEIRLSPDRPEQIVVIKNVALDEISERFQDYPENWPIMLAGQLRREGTGGALVEFEEGVETLRSQLPNPIYGDAEMLLGRGIVGGKLLDGAHHARQAAQLAQRILNGESVDDITPIEASENLWMFDARELARFNIDLGELPPHSELINQESSFYQRYQGLVWITVVAFSASGLIILLLIDVLRRRAAAAQVLRENEQRYRDLAESGADLFWEIDTQLCFSY